MLIFITLCLELTHFENLDKFGSTLTELNASCNRIITLTSIAHAQQWGEQSSFGLACLSRLQRLDLHEN